jgi:putative PIN family toxin of toxin-antitoxin system
VIRVTADSNIYISALLFGGPPDDILTLARRGKILLSISDAIVEEVTRVLRNKFAFSDEALAAARHQITQFTEHVTPTTTLTIVTEDPTDNRILECAEAGRSDYLVTRDRHLLKLNSFGKIKIVLAADFLAAFRAAGQEV